MPPQQPIPPIAAMTPLRNGVGLLFPETLVQLRQEFRGQVASQGRPFSKIESLYLPFTPFLPLAWAYDCGNCVFYQCQARTCEIVDGSIEPVAWCGFWVSRVEDPPFSWMVRALGP